MQTPKATSHSTMAHGLNTQTEETKLQHKKMKSSSYIEAKIKHLVNNLKIETNLNFWILPV
jgi:hypothetical protein